MSRRVTPLWARWFGFLSNEDMQERNLIGGVTATVLTPFVEGWPKLLPWLILAIVLLLVDLRFGIKAAEVRGESIRRSRAVRRSINKLVDYICWISIAWLFGLTFGQVFDIPIITYIVLTVIYRIEVQSIVDNYFEYKGLKIKFSVLKFFAQLFKKPEIADYVEKKDENDNEKK